MYDGFHLGIGIGYGFMNVEVIAKICPVGVF